MNFQMSVHINQRDNDNKTRKYNVYVLVLDCRELMVHGMNKTCNLHYHLMMLAYYNSIKFLILNVSQKLQ